MEDYVSRAEALGVKMASAGEPVSDQSLALSVLDGLPKEYSTFRFFCIEDTGRHEALTITTMLPSLQRIYNESQPVEDAPPPTGLMGHTRDMDKRQQYKFKGNCNYCHRKGHKEAECRKKRRELVSANKPSPSKHTAMMAQRMASSASAVVLDSGCSTHMTGDRHLLQEYRAFKLASLVTFGNGSGQAEGQGDLTLEGLEGTVTLHKVLYVPGLRYTLLSVRAAAAKGVDFYIPANSTTAIMRKDGETVLTASLTTDGLYVADLAPGGAQVLAATALAAGEHPTPSDWHRRFNHLGYDALARLARDDMVTGVDCSAADFLAEKTDVICEDCVLAKEPRKPFLSAGHVTTAPGELMHADLIGPIRPSSRCGASYVLDLVDDFSKLSAVTLLHTKSADEVSAAIISTVLMLEQKTGEPVQRFRSDGGCEFVNEKLASFFKSKHIEHETSAPYTPQQNGVAERMNRTLLDRVRAMLLDSGLPGMFWGEAFLAANYVRNRSPVTGSPLVPWEAAFGDKPDVRHLRVFGSKAFVLKNLPSKSKVDPKRFVGTLVGYEPGGNYRILAPNRAGKMTVQVHRDVVFNELSRQYQAAGGAQADDSSTIDVEDFLDDARPHPAVLPVVTPAAPTAEDQYLPDDSDNVLPPLEHVETDEDNTDEEAHWQSANRPVRARQQPQHFVPEDFRANLAQPMLKDPSGEFTHPMDFSPDSLARLTAKTALARPDGESFRDAMLDELKSLYEHKCWRLVDLPSDAKIIQCRWVFAVKRDSKGNIVRYKARLVAKGFTQEPGVDFTEIYAPVSKFVTLRAFLSMVAKLHLAMESADVKTAFLNGQLDEVIYMQQPPGFEQGGANTVCKLDKSLYGLRQAPRQWHAELRRHLEAMGFQASEADSSFFISTSGATVYLLVYVDDILVASHQLKDVKSTICLLQDCFELRVIGEPDLFLNLQLSRDMKAGTIFVSQPRFVTALVEKYNPRPRTTPMQPGLKLQRAGTPMAIDQRHYSSVVGSLLYISNATRPDASYAAGVLCRFMQDPQEEHWKAALWLLGYLSATQQQGLTFGSGDGLCGYTDSAYGDDIDTRRSTSGFVFTFNGGPISWSSKLQRPVALSTCEAEYMASAHAAKEALWLRKLLPELQHEVANAPIVIYADNEAAIQLTKNPVHGERTKHIGTAFNMVRQHVNQGELKFVYCNTKENVADVFTKAFSAPKLTFFKKYLGMLT